VTPPAADSPPVDLRALRRSILAWYERHGRTLEFRHRGHPDAWGVLVSEVMAQQTQVSRVEERWPAFMAAFPTPAAMAGVPPSDVIRAWRGLGYNRRAINLHRAAVAITEAGGAVPGELDALRALPGVGPYTARAVAAIAFGLPVAAVDVNVRRVVGRIAAGDEAALAPVALQAMADELLDRRRPGTWTHALMDLGATTCRPAGPACPECPAQRWCVAAASGRFLPRVARRTTTAPRVPFKRSSRWLRGRIVDRLRDAPAGTPVTFDGPIGEHPPSVVTAALAGLARDGVVELLDPRRARLPGGEAVA
jgi:A/G-specific adenine glycosylase